MTQKPRDLIISVITPAGIFGLEGLIYGQAISFLVDTGAAVTLMRKDTWDKVTQGQKVDLEPYREQQLVSVDGTPLQVYGHASMDLLLNGNKYEAGIVVVSLLITEAIPGLDFMRKHEVTIDLGKAEIKLGREDAITIHQHNQSPHVLGSVCLLDSVRLPPLSEIVVMAYSDELTQGGTYIVEEKPGKSLACSLAHALVEPRNGKVSIRLLKPKTEVVVIPKHVQVGTIELVNVSLGVVANTSASPVQSDPI